MLEVLSVSSFVKLSLQFTQCCVFQASKKNENVYSLEFPGMHIFLVIARNQWVIKGFVSAAQVKVSYKMLFCEIVN